MRSSSISIQYTCYDESDIECTVHIGDAVPCRPTTIDFSVMQHRNQYLPPPRHTRSKEPISTCQCIK